MAEGSTIASSSSFTGSFSTSEPSFSSLQQKERIKFWNQRELEKLEKEEQGGQTTQQAPDPPISENKQQDFRLSTTAGFDLKSVLSQAKSGLKPASQRKFKPPSSIGGSSKGSSAPSTFQASSSFEGSNLSQSTPRQQLQPQPSPFKTWQQPQPSIEPTPTKFPPTSSVPSTPQPVQASQPEQPPVREIETVPQLPVEPILDAETKEAEIGESSLPSALPHGQQQPQEKEIYSTPLPHQDDNGSTWLDQAHDHFRSKYHYPRDEEAKDSSVVGFDESSTVGSQFSWLLPGYSFRDQAPKPGVQLFYKMRPRDPPTGSGSSSSSQAPWNIDPLAALQASKRNGKKKKRTSKANNTTTITPSSPSEAAYPFGSWVPSPYLEKSYMTNREPARMLKRKPLGEDDSERWVLSREELAYQRREKEEKERLKREQEMSEEQALLQKQQAEIQRQEQISKQKHLQKEQQQKEQQQWKEQQRQLIQQKQQQQLQQQQQQRQQWEQQQKEEEQWKERQRQLILQRQQQQLQQPLQQQQQQQQQQPWEQQQQQLILQRQQQLQQPQESIIEEEIIEEEVIEEEVIEEEFVDEETYEEGEVSTFPDEEMSSVEYSSRHIHATFPHQQQGVTDPQQLPWNQPAQAFAPAPMLAPAPAPAPIQPPTQAPMLSPTPSASHKPKLRKSLSRSGRSSKSLGRSGRSSKSQKSANIFNSTQHSIDDYEILKAEEEEKIKALLIKERKSTAVPSKAAMARAAFRSGASTASSFASSGFFAGDSSSSRSSSSSDVSSAYYDRKKSWDGYPASDSDNDEDLSSTARRVRHRRRRQTIKSRQSDRPGSSYVGNKRRSTKVDYLRQRSSDEMGSGVPDNDESDDDSYSIFIGDEKPKSHVMFEDDDSDSSSSLPSSVISPSSDSSSDVFADEFPDYHGGSQDGAEYEDDSDSSSSLDTEAQRQRMKDEKYDDTLNVGWTPSSKCIGILVLLNCGVIAWGIYGIVWLVRRNERGTTTVAAPTSAPEAAASLAAAVSTNLTQGILNGHHNIFNNSHN